MEPEDLCPEHIDPKGCLSFSTKFFMNTVDAELPQKRNFSNSPIHFPKDPGSSCTEIQEEKVSLNILNVTQRWWIGVLQVLSKEFNSVKRRRAKITDLEKNSIQPQRKFITPIEKFKMFCFKKPKKTYI